jgi:4-amino-4-deoxy-L-arabinose transferase-like glycosyltransferase
MLQPEQNTLPRAAFLVLAAMTVLMTFGDVLIQELHGTAAFYAALSREMLELGDFVAPFKGEQAYLLKPPLAFWLSAVSAWVLGINDFAMTLPSRLAGLGCIWMTFLIARRLFGTPAAWYAALIFPTNGLYIQFTTNFRIDSLMTLGALLILWGYLQFRDGKGMGAFCAGLALSILTKGPMIFAMLLAFLPHLFFCGRRPALAAQQLGWTLLLLLPAAWYGYLWWLHGNALSSQLNHDFWRGDTAVGLSALDSALLEYLYKPLRRLWPWLPVLIAAIPFALMQIVSRAKAREYRANVALLFGLFLINYFIAAIKPDPDVRYLYPSLPLLAVLAGGLLARLSRGLLPRAVVRMTWGLLALTLAYAGLISARGWEDARGLEQIRALAESTTITPNNSAVIVDFIPRPDMPRRNDPLPDSLYYYLGFVPARVSPLQTLAELPADTRYVLIRRKKVEVARLEAMGLRTLAQSARLSLLEVPVTVAY